LGSVRIGSPRAPDVTGGSAIILEITGRLPTVLHRCGRTLNTKGPNALERLEGLAKLTGRERYVDDLPLGDGLWGMTVRSPAPRGRVRRVRFGGEIDWSRYVVVDHRDIPGPNAVFLIEHDQPVLVAEHTRHVHEAVVLIAHESREAVRRAVRAVTIEIDEADPALDFTAPPTPAQVQYGADNVFRRLQIRKGDVDAAMGRAAHVIEGVYDTGAQEHVYIENQGMIAWTEGDVVAVRGSMQCPYYVLNALQHALDRDASRLRVVHAPTGGGFGGKEDYPSLLALHAALLAMKAGRPVRMIYDRGEDMAATTKRHPARIRHRTAVDRTGRLLAQEIDVLLDGGAYVTLSPVVLSRAIIHAAGPYACDHVRITGRAVLTNSVPYGAFRGFGAPQTQFANERHMNVIAERLGLDPVAVRRDNLIRDGQSTSTGQVIDDGTDRVAVLETALDRADYATRRREHAAFNASSADRRRGIGIATFYHGAGFTGSGEVHLASEVHVGGLPDGRVEVLAANTEMGQGTTTIFTQIVVGHLGLEAAEVVIAEPDTARVPNSGPTVASRTVMVVGRLIERACDDLRRKIGLDDGARGAAVTASIARWHREHPGRALRAAATYQPPTGVRWDDATYRGDAYATFAWAAYVAEVEVDLRTYGTRVIDFTAVQEIGKVLNPTLATGQVAGGVVQGIGWALMEACVWRDGAMANTQLTNYIIPTSDDVPPIRVVFLENPFPGGAQGAKGLGELPIDGPAPAIVNAVADALSVSPESIPLTPERLHRLVQEGCRDAG
jgi:CO/xanthine dehydrogenase Mo-binding subunit